jgi:hypothetical protein
VISYDPLSRNMGINNILNKHWDLLAENQQYLPKPLVVWKKSDSIQDILIKATSSS